MAPAAKRRRLSEDENAVDVALADLKDDLHRPDRSDAGPDPPSIHAKLSSSLFIRSLPSATTTQTLANHFSQSYPLKHAVVVVDRNTRKSRGFGFVTFADVEDARKARDEFNGSTLEGKRIKVEMAEPRHREAADGVADGPRKSRPVTGNQSAKAFGNDPEQDPRAPPKLIVRNLPWSVKSSEELSMLFRSYGKVKHAVLPQKKPGLSPGFGFVVIRGLKNAEKAMAGINGKVVDGRTLAVDWAVDKPTWQKLQEEELHDNNEDLAPTFEPGAASISISSESKIDTPRADRAEILGDDEEEGKKGKENDDEDEDDEEEEEEEEEEEDAQSSLSIGDNASFGTKPLDTSILDEKAPKEDFSHTLFIRNLPFSVSDDMLSDHFQQFGPLRYARVVLDPGTERSRGTGFVCFVRSDDARQCLRGASKIMHQSRPNSVMADVKHSILEDTGADPLGHFSMEGRVLQISPAVDRSEAQRLTIQGQDTRESRERDKRRLYLLAEGTVSARSPLYTSLAPSEIKLREESATQRQTLVKNNPMLHISLTRLSVRNIPRHLTSKDLKALAREAVVRFAEDVKEGRRQQLSKEELARGGPAMRAAEQERKSKGKGIVKQAHIVFEGKDGRKVDEKTGAGKSRGYGFIEYASHRWALMGLRWLNGSQVGQKPGDARSEDAVSTKALDKARRLIVEFAIENAQVVARRYARQEKARQHIPSPQKAPNGPGDPEEGGSTSRSLNGSQTKLGKRKWTSQVTNSQPQTRSDKEALESAATLEEKARRNRIIGKKRAMRRSRKS